MTLFFLLCAIFTAFSPTAVQPAGETVPFQTWPCFMNLENSDENDPVHIPIDGVLDLHNFNPSDLGTLIDEYIRACLEKEIYQIRIIHGKGTGTLRRSVHHLLERNRHVVSYELAGGRSGWGATVVQLKSERLSE